MKLIIEDDDGNKNVIPLVQEEMELTIGRQEDNTIRLNERNVSRKHARLIRRKGTVLLEDLGSYCGVKVNGQRISTMVRVSNGDVIQIGDFDLTLQKEPGDDVGGAPSASAIATAMAGSQNKAAGSPGAPAGAPAGEEALPLSSGSAKPRLSTSIISLENPKVYDDIRPQDIPLEQAPHLIIESGGSSEISEYALIRTVMTLGRDFENDVAIDHRSLSHNHCKFVRTAAGEWKVIDTGSSNGVQVNGEKYEVSSLASGDVILVGKVKLRFQMPGETRTVFSRNRVPPLAYVGIGAGVVILLGIVFFLVKGSGDSPVPEPTIAAQGMPAAVQTQPAPLADSKSPQPAAAPESSAGAGTAAASSDSASPASASEPSSASPSENGTAAAASAQAADTPAPASAADSVGSKFLDEGKALMAAGKFSAAMGALAKASERNVPGAAELLEKAASESDASDSLKAAKEHLQAGKLDEAKARLGEIPQESYFAKEAAEVGEQVSAALQEQKSKTEKKAAEKKSSGKRRASGEGNSYGSAYAEIPDDKLKELEGYLGEECDKPDKAIPFLKKLTRENSDYGYAYLYLGSCYIANGNTDAGVKQYKYFLKRWPKHPDAPMVREQMSE